VSPRLPAVRCRGLGGRQPHRVKIIVQREFAAKNAICLKESREARFWLRVADAKRLGDERRRKYLLQESNELVSIYVVIVRKLKAK
jgi:hypothetical protein